MTATGVLYGHGALSHGLEIGVCNCNVSKAQPEVLNRPTWWPLSLPGRHPLEQLVQRVHQQTWFDKRPGQEGREKSRIDVLQSQRRGERGACEREGRKQWKTRRDTVGMKVLHEAEVLCKPGTPPIAG